VTNTTPRYYEINGTSLQTYRWNLQKIDGIHSRPALRGANPSTPYRHGSYSFGRKFFEEKFIVLRMAILNTDADGAITLPDSWAHLYKNLDDFLGLLYDTKQLVLSRYLADGVTQRQINVEVVDEAIIKTEAADQRYLVDIPMVAARPFWEELPLITDTENAITGLRAFNIDVDGNAPTDDMVITIDCTSAGSSPQLVVPVTGDEIVIADASISGGDQIIIDLGNRQFTKNGNRYDQAVDHNRAWFIELPKGPVTLGMEFDSASGTYNLKLERYNKWF
jgi:hypothetical protein